MNGIAIAVIVVTVIGILCAVMLAVASKVMAVKEDERFPAVRECLPGANCGACGFPGCDGYAKALLEDPDLPVNLCVPGAGGAAAALAGVLGKEAGEVVKKIAFVKCNGDCDATKDKLEYRGITTCAASKLMFGGAGSCVFGCMGLGDCAAACPENAIKVINGVARVNPNACIGCGICAKTCPNGIISVMPEAVPVVVKCSNKEKGAVARKECTNACIACGMCQRKCPSEAITVVNNLAVIDYEKCTGCGTCKSVCPAKAIH